MCERGFVEECVCSEIYSKKKREYEQQKQPTGHAYLPYVAGVTDRLKKVLEKKYVQIRFNIIKKMEQLLFPRTQYLDDKAKVYLYQLQLFHCEKS